jgi:hypothetical protein
MRKTLLLPLPLLLLLLPPLLLLLTRKATTMATRWHQAEEWP